MTEPIPDDTTDLRAYVELRQRANDADLQTLAQQGIDLSSAITNIRTVELAEVLLGDMDDPRRLAYESGCQERFTALIADVRAQLARARLLEGVNGQQVTGAGPR